MPWGSDRFARMSGNPRDSKWANGPARSERKRKKIEITLSDAALEKLDVLAEGRPRSHVIEELILSPRRKKK